jgi:hypothetical protein
METYKEQLFSESGKPLKDPSNMIMLRADLHSIFDTYTPGVQTPAFVLYPKGPQSSLVVHMLLQKPDIGLIYHNVKLHEIRGVRPEFLLTRFTLSIFPAVRQIPLSPRLARQQIPTYGEDEASEGYDGWPTAERSRSSSRGRGRGRSGSRKRSFSASNRGGLQENERPRGRKRRRDDTCDEYDHSLTPRPPRLRMPPIEILRQNALAAQRPASYLAFCKRKKTGREKLEYLGVDIRDDISVELVFDNDSR